MVRQRCVAKCELIRVPGARRATVALLLVLVTVYSGFIAWCVWSDQGNDFAVYYLSIPR